MCSEGYFKIQLYIKIVNREKENNIEYITSKEYFNVNSVLI